MLRESLDWLEQSAWADAIRQSLWMYPTLEIIHILGIVLLVGSAFLFDLRLLGVSANLPFTRLSYFLLSWSRRGLILVIPSGLLLFITNSVTLGLDPTFWLKIALLIMAGLNAFLFHKFSRQERIEPIPRFRVHALLSILFWIGVILSLIHI